MKHKHADLIHAWADGARIEYLDKQNGVWEETTNPWWEETATYRIKPEVREYFFEELVHITWSKDFCIKIGFSEGQKPNLKLLFDADTGKLISAEVLP
jgi:hypothetical protein